MGPLRLNRLLNNKRLFEGCSIYQVFLDYHRYKVRPHCTCGRVLGLGKVTKNTKQVCNCKYFTRKTHLKA